MEEAGQKLADRESRAKGRESQHEMAVVEEWKLGLQFPNAVSNSNECVGSRYRRKIMKFLDGLNWQAVDRWFGIRDVKSRPGEEEARLWLALQPPKPPLASSYPASRTGDVAPLKIRRTSLD